MPTDRFTWLMIDLIAISLSVIALRPFLSPVVAGAQVNGCSDDPYYPCYIAGWGPDGTVPIANSGRFRLKVLVGNPSANPTRAMVVNPPLALYRPWRKQL
jgi:hypothetical protein